MPDLLLEFLSEEIPARMQARAAEDLCRLVTGGLVAASLTYEGAQAYAGPRRLTLSVHGVPAKQPDIREEKKGPRIRAPVNAIAGFLKNAGMKSIDEAKVQPDKKGDFYVAVIKRPGRAAIEVIAEIIPDVVRKFPWPKSMHWGEETFADVVTESGEKIVTENDDQVVVPDWIRWVRPLHSIVATFGPETEEPEIVKFKIGEIESGNETRGHRFMAPAAFKVRHFDDYAVKLAEAKVMLDAGRRTETIRTDAKNLAFAQSFELVEDEGLLAEVAGLVEWPVALMGTFDETFLAIPEEVIRTTIRNNQKCFVLRDAQTAKLVNRFILIANKEAADGGKAIIAGNERVIRARLSDAKFFYDTDLKTSLEDRLPKFEYIVFHEKLGSQAERIARIEALAGELADIVGAEHAKAERAARLCKADLLTEAVGEFPELQGLMGRYYAEAQGEGEAVAHAIEDHYKPKGPDDLVPAEPVSITVALADKIDTLVGFWLIEEKPTGSKDPYALRRAALGVIRIILENELRLPLRGQLWQHFGAVGRDEALAEAITLLHPLHEQIIALSSTDIELAVKLEVLVSEKNRKVTGPVLVQAHTFLQQTHDLLAFFADRLKVQLREQGARHDLVDAVFAVGGQDDLLMVVRRVEALGQFLDSDDGKNLLEGYKRATNIIRIEEKKDKRDYTDAPDGKLYVLAEERALASAIAVGKKDAAAAVAKEDFAAAMRVLASLRPEVDAFFDKVTVNVDDQALRENRLKLLNEVREATLAVADFSKIEG